MTINKKTLRQVLVVAFLSATVSPYSANAQGDNEAPQVDRADKVSLSVEKELSQQLDELSQSIIEKRKELQKLKSKSPKTGTNPDLDSEIDVTTQQLEVLNKSFEQLAVGYIDLEINSKDEPELTWQEELTLAIKPLLENLRGLTEEPRKKENLRQIIASQEATLSRSEKALLSIEKLIENNPSTNQKRILQSVQSKWQRIKENAESEKQLAVFQLESLSNSDSNWLVDLKKSTVAFFQDRGVTIALAVLVSIAIWAVLTGFHKLIDRVSSAKIKHQRRTTYRIVAYARRLLTVALIVIGILTVFFVRGDILLLIITLALLFAGALGLKSFLPQFVAESRLLLNIGSVREQEQVVIDGVPWRVATINIFSKLTNPYIQGVLRLPMSDIKEMVSRPVKEEKWFPSSIGDWVVDNDDNLYEVIRQTPVVVELQSAQGTNKLVPTPTYFSSGVVNLTKSKRIRITSTFGVGYELQKKCLTDVPLVLKEVVSEFLLAASLDTDRIDVRVEFANAGESSLDYIIIAHIDSIASKHYYRIKRVIQQACVEACNRNDWGIPFPQLTVHHLPAE